MWSSPILVIFRFTLDFGDFSSQVSPETSCSKRKFEPVFPPRVIRVGGLTLQVTLPPMCPLGNLAISVEHFQLQRFHVYSYQTSISTNRHVRNNLLLRLSSFLYSTHGAYTAELDGRPECCRRRVRYLSEGGAARVAAGVSQWITLG